MPRSMRHDSWHDASAAHGHGCAVRRVLITAKSCGMPAVHDAGWPWPAKGFSCPRDLGRCCQYRRKTRQCVIMNVRMTRCM
jgi:hypothetical protein